MSATERVIGGDEVRVNQAGNAQVTLCLPWYRSLAPSTVEDIAVSIDGHTIPRNELTVEINGIESELDAIADRWQETWFVQDRAIVRFPAPGDLNGAVNTTLSITLRIPYILTGPDSALKRSTSETRKLSVVREEQP